MDSVAAWVYFLIGCLALGLALLSFLIGEVMDFVHDLAGPVVDWAGDHLSFGHEHDVGFSRFINSGGVLGFVSGFGFTASFAMSYFNHDAVVGALFGIGGGIVLGAVVGAFWFLLRTSEGTVGYNEEQLTGVRGVITERIIPGGQGRAQFTMSGINVWHTVQAESGEELVPGTAVQVTRVVGSVLYVVPEQ